LWHEYDSLLSNKSKQEIAKFIEAVFPEVEPGELKGASHLCQEVTRTLLNLWVDDEKDITVGLPDLGLTVYDILGKDKHLLKEMGIKYLQEAFSMMPWPYGTQHKWSQFLQADGDIQSTAKSIAESVGNTSPEDIERTIRKLVDTLNNRVREIDDNIESYRDRIFARLRSAMHDIREHIFFKKVGVLLLNNSFSAKLMNDKFWIRPTWLSSGLLYPIMMSCWNASASQLSPICLKKCLITVGTLDNTNQKPRGTGQIQICTLHSRPQNLDWKSLVSSKLKDMDCPVLNI